MLSDPKHQAGITGEVNIDHLSPNPLVVNAGIFNLFANADEIPITKKMVYRLDLSSTTGTLQKRGERV